MQNASQENAIFFISIKMSASGDMIRIAPGEQGTWWQVVEKMSWIDDNDVLVKNLDALGFVQLYFNVSPITNRNAARRAISRHGCSKSSPTARTPCAGLTGLPTRTIRKPCVRRSNDGQTGMRNDKGVLRRSAGPERPAPGISDIPGAEVYDFRFSAFTKGN